MKQLLLLALIAFAVWKGYEHFVERPTAAPPQTVVADTAARVGDTMERASDPQRFRCDSRQHCSQMASRAEAEFFVRHCPNTKMDGDRDGEPCENDSRF